MSYILLIVIVLILYVGTSQKTKENYSPYYAIPDKNEFISISNPLDMRYEYLPNRNIYLLPYQYLNFDVPYHRWMYYYHPYYYGIYYKYNWPFVNKQPIKNKWIR